MGELKCIPHISHARVSATSCNISHASRLTASDAAWECEREFYLPCKCRHKYREDTHVFHTHTHTRALHAVLQLREQISLTLLTHLQRKLDLCVSLSLTSLLRLLFFSTFCRCWSAVAQSVENALLLCVVRAAAAPCRAASLCTCATLRRVFKPIANNRQLQLAITNMP